MDYKEFAQKVKAKYPQYQDMDDFDLAQRMVSKYPTQYSDVVFPAQPEKQKQPSFTERFVENVQQPFTKLGQMAGSPPAFMQTAKVLDAPMGIVGNLYDASAKLGKSLRPEVNDIGGAVEAGTRIGATAMTAPFLPAVTAFNVATGALPEGAQKVVSAPFNPAKTIAGDGDVPATIDNLIQMGLGGLGLAKGATSPQKFSGQRMKIAEKNILRSAPPKGEVNYNIQQDLKAFAPYLKEEALKGFDKTGQINRQTEVKINRSLQKFYDTRLRPQIDRAIAEGAEVDMKSAINEMQSTLGVSDAVFEPTKAKAITDIASRVPERMTIAEADAMLKDLNAKTKKFEEASTADQAKMLNADPALEARIAFKRGLRDAIVQSMESVGEAGTKKLREVYGSGARLRSLVRENVLPAENQAREPIIRIGGRYTAGGIGENILAKVMGRTKEGEMRRGMTRVGRYAENPPKPEIPNAELLNILYRNRYGAE